MTARGSHYWNNGDIPLIAPEILGNIIADVADLGVVITEDGIVLSVLINPVYDGFRKLEAWEGRDIRTALTVESVPKFDERLAAFLAGKPDVRPVELNHMDKGGQWDFPVRYSLHRIGPEGAVLMLGRDLRPVAEMQQQLVKAQLALEQDYETQREYDTRFRVLMNGTRDAMVFVSVATGKISEVNGRAATLFDRSHDQLVGQSFAALFDARSRSDLMAHLTSEAFADQAAPVQTELRAGMPVQIVPTMFRAAGERVLLCRIESKDTRDIAQDDLSEQMRGLFRAGPDAIVFTSDSGVILAANEGFLNLIDTANDVNVRGRGLSDYFQRGSVDMKVMMENATRAGQMKMYATKVAGDYGSPRAVEISVTRIIAGKSSVFAFVMRGGSRSDQTRAAPSATSDEGMQSVVELVGSATLKDIVAETTNVVEKMCIQTAVELTMNNRVAAAEMLGLSRQSLYVKLRKFDLLSRDGSDDRDQ